MAKRARPVEIDEVVISSKQAGQLILKTAERVRQLCKEGWFPKLAKDQYRLLDVMVGYVKFRDDVDRRSIGSAAENRVRAARAEEIELRTAIRAKDLIRTDECFEVTDTALGAVRTEMGSVPARVTRDLTLRRSIEDAINEGLGRAADVLQKMAEKFGREETLLGGAVRAGATEDPQT